MILRQLSKSCMCLWCRSCSSTVWEGRLWAPCLASGGPLEHHHPQSISGDNSVGARGSINASASPFPCNLLQTVSVHYNCCVCDTFYTYNLTPRNFMADLLLGVSSSSQAVSLCLQSGCKKRFWLLFPHINIYISSWVSKGNNHLAAFFGSMCSPSALLTLEAIDFLVMLRVAFGGQPLWWKRM